MECKTREISSEQLIHFVKEKQYLIQILNHNFYPRICCEDAITSLFKSNVYVPMKCFCDIPLECIQEHIAIYGEYGIGFSRQWGVKIGLNPVIYYNERSPYIQNIKKIYNDYISRINNTNKDTQCSNIAEMIRILKSSFTMYKPIYGKYKRNLKGGEYNFYDEREWRYILPAITSTAYLQGDNLPQELIEHYNGVKKDEMWKKGKLELENQIEFSYDDIDFVIIPSACDINEIIEALPQCDTEKIKNKITTLEALIMEKNKKNI